MSMRNRVMFVRAEIPALLGEPPDVIHAHQLLNGGRITVLNRMTGFGHRDIETGYRSPCGGFWLASGHIDVRQHLDELADEDAMIDWIIARCPYGAVPGERTAYTSVTRGRMS